MVRKKKKGRELLENLSEVDRYEAERLLTIEATDRSILDEQERARVLAAEFKHGIDELKAQAADAAGASKDRVTDLKADRKAALAELESFRLGERRLPLDDPPAAETEVAA